MARSYTFPTEPGASYVRTWDLKIVHLLSFTTAADGTVQRGYHDCVTGREEEVTLRADGQYTIQRATPNARGWSLTMPEDPATTFPLRHPDTDEVIGEMSFADLYLALHSAGRYGQTQRDDAETSEGPGGPYVAFRG